MNSVNRFAVGSGCDSRHTPVTHRTQTFLMGPNKFVTHSTLPLLEPCSKESQEWGSPFLLVGCLAFLFGAEIQTKDVLV